MVWTLAEHGLQKKRRRRLPSPANFSWSLIQARWRSFGARYDVRCLFCRCQSSQKQEKRSIDFKAFSFFFSLFLSLSQTKQTKPNQQMNEQQTARATLQRKSNGSGEFAWKALLSATNEPVASSETRTCTTTQSSDAYQESLRMTRNQNF